jgi:hypothetical protein
MPPGERLPADEEIHARLARHGFLVSDDVDDPEGADDLASTMLSVIESMLATGPANEPPVGAAGGDDSAGPLLSRPSTSS